MVTCPRGRYWTAVRFMVAGALGPAAADSCQDDPNPVQHQRRPKPGAIGSCLLLACDRLQMSRPQVEASLAEFVFVHGMGQEQSGPAVLGQDWRPALSDGVLKAEAPMLADSLALPHGVA